MHPDTPGIVAFFTILVIIVSMWLIWIHFDTKKLLNRARYIKNNPIFYRREECTSSIIDVSSQHQPKKTKMTYTKETFEWADETLELEEKYNVSG